jgi:hypothetical protein
MQSVTILFALDKNRLHINNDKTERTESYFIENKGQIGDQFGNPNPFVKYLIVRPGLNIQLKANSFSYDAYTIQFFDRQDPLKNIMYQKGVKHKIDSLVYQFSRIDVELVDANPNPRISHDVPSNDYLNFYTHITSQTKGDEGVTHVRSYTSITYHDIYPNIDLEWFLDAEGKPEYQFIINPGGDPSKIRLKYHGAQKTELEGNAIQIYIKQGIIKESIPISYLANSKVEIDVEYAQLSENEYGFTIPKYSASETLIIDPVPNRLWGTYIGGNDNVYTNEIALNSSSELYAVGSTTSSISIATTGTHQSSIAGDWDVYINKFTSNAIRIWGTYYGGAQLDYGNTISLDGSSNIYCGGLTFSGSGISTSGAHQMNRNGNNDGIIAKFNPQGIRQWGTYYGGSVSESVHDISIDESDDLYIAGMSNSNDNISTSGAFQTTFSGNQDLFLLKLTQSGSRLWCTYYGGTLEESIPRVSARSGNIILVGKAWSDNLGSSGTHQPNRSGYYDGIIVKFNASGSRVWASYYGGLEYEDIVGVAQNQNGTIFIAGSTESQTGIATTGVFQTTYGGGDVYGDAFIASLSQSGSRLWGSYYGGSDDDLGKGVHCDQNGNVFIIGQSSSVSGIASSGSYQETYGLYKDVFFAKLNSNGQRVYGSYYGGPEDDDGSNILFSNNSLYLCGITWSGGIFGSIGTHQPDITGYHIYNGFISKFDDSGSQTVQTITSSVNSLQFCEQGKPSVTYTVTGTFNSPNTFTVQLSNASGSFANPTVIGTLNSTTSGTIQCQIPVNIPPGTGYRIRVVSSNPVIIGSDNGSNITIHTLPQPSITGSLTACTGQSTYSYSVNNIAGHTYLWSPLQKGMIIGSSTSNTVTIKWISSGYDTLKIRQTNSLGGCIKDTFIVVSIGDAPLPFITGNSTACVSTKDIPYSVPSVAGHTYQWFAPTKGFISGTTSGNAINVTWSQVGNDSIKVRQTNPLSGCFKDTLIYVTIHPIPLPVISGTLVVCAGDKNTNYSVTQLPGHVYQWSSIRNGKINGSNTGHSVSIDWNTPGLDTVKIRQTNSSTGCFKDTLIYVTIQRLPNPTISGSQIVCEGEVNTSYSVLSVPGHVYQWSSLRNGKINNSSTGNTVSIDWNMPGIDTVKIRQTNTLTGCVKDTICIVTVNPKPKTVVSGSSTVCLSSSLETYSVTKNSGYSYFWYPPKFGVIMGSQKDNSVNVLWTNTGIDTIRISINNGITGCVRDTFIIVSIVNAIKPVIASFGNQNVLCKGDSRGLECLTDAQSYQWKRNGKIIEGATDNIYLAFEAGDYSAQIKSGLCEGESDILELIEYDVPKPVIMGEKEVMSGSTEQVYQVSNIGMKSTLWSVSDNAIIKGDQRSNQINIQFPEPGIVKVTAKQESNLGCTGEDSLFILVKSMTDVKESQYPSKIFNISPNPTGESDQFIIRFAENQHQDISIELLDILGSVHYSHTLKAGSESCTIPVQGLSSGMYMLRVRMNNEVFIEKVIVN